MGWSSKDFSDRVIKILSELEFNDFKKISKDIFKAVLKLGKIEVPFVLNIHYSKKKSIQEDEIKMFYADMSSGKSMEKGIFIGYPEFSKKAREVAEKLNIITMDINELLESLVDTSLYRASFLNAQPPIKNYITPRLSEKENILDLDAFVASLSQSENQPVFIEGEIGIGKTTFLKELSSSIGKKTIKNVSEKIPFYVDLKNYSSYSQLEDFLFQEVFRKNQIKIRSNKAFEILCGENRLLFLIDNLDKVGPADSDKIIKLGKDLKKLAQAGILCLFTAPVGYFSVDLKTKFYHSGFYNLFEDISPTFLKFEHFTLSQIKQKLTNLKLQRIISRNEFLKEICKVPVFLDIFSHLETDEDTLAKFSDIYKESIKQWKSEYLTSLGKETFCEEMAKKLFDKGEFNLKTDTPEYLENFIQNNFKTLPFSLELLKKDLQKAFFIKEQENSNFEFIHSSFVYFFIAKRIVEEIRKGNYNNLQLLASSMIIRFVSDSMDSEKIFNVIIERYNREKFAKDKGDIFFLLYRVAELLDKVKEIPMNRISTHKLEAQGKRLSNLQIANVDFKESDFKNSDFSYSKCEKVDFSSSNLENANFSFAEFKKSIFNGSNLKYINAKNVNFSESIFHRTILFQSACLKSDFTRANLYGANLHGILAVESNFEQSEWREVEISNGDFTVSNFDNAIFEDIVCRSGLFAFAKLKRASFKNTSFPFSFFNQADFSEANAENTNFAAINLWGSSFEKAKLTQVNFKNADLRNVSFKNAVLTKVDLRGADLRGADFGGAKICEETRKNMILALK